MDKFIGYIGHKQTRPWLAMLHATHYIYVYIIRSNSRQAHSESVPEKKPQIKPVCVHAYFGIQKCISVAEQIFLS